MSKKTHVTGHRDQGLAVSFGDPQVVLECFLELGVVIQLHVDALDEEQVGDQRMIFLKRIGTVDSARKKRGYTRLTGTSLDQPSLDFDLSQVGIPTRKDFLD